MPKMNHLDMTINYDCNVIFYGVSISNKNNDFFKKIELNYQKNEKKL
jgi:hypothetical protein